MSDASSHPGTPEALPATFLPGLSQGALPRRYGDADHWRRVATAAGDQGEIDTAMRCWAHVKRLQPEARDADFHIACCHALQGRRERAAHSFADLAADPTVSPMLRRRALRLAQLLDVEPL